MKLAAGRAFILSCAATLGLALHAPAAFAQARADQPALDPAGDRIVVRGRELEEIARAFVEGAADQLSSNYGLARWDGSVCVAVENLQVGAAQYIVDRVSEVALDLGLAPGEPGCDPNISIVFTTDGQAMAAYLVEEERRLFRPYGGEGGVQQGLAAMHEFGVSEAPVRWWQISMPMTRDNQIAIRLPGQDPPVVGGCNSGIIRCIHDELWSSFIIVDAAKLDEVNAKQLADYLAMVALAQIDPKAEIASFDSILNLFEEEAPAYGLTRWDLGYLRGLYAFNQELNPRVHRGALADAIAEEIARGDEEQE